MGAPAWKSKQTNLTDPSLQHYQTLIRGLKKRHPHLAGINFNIKHDARRHDVNIVLGAGDIYWTKATGIFSGKPIAEKTACMVTDGTWKMIIKFELL